MISIGFMSIYIQYVYIKIIWSGSWGNTRFLPQCRTRMAGQLRFGEGWRVRMLVVSTKCSVPPKVSKNIAWNRLLKRAMWTKMTGWKPSWQRSTKNWTNDVLNISFDFRAGTFDFEVVHIHLDMLIGGPISFWPWGMVGPWRWMFSQWSPTADKPVCVFLV